MAAMGQSFLRILVAAVCYLAVTATTLAGETGRVYDPRNRTTPLGSDPVVTSLGENILMSRDLSLGGPLPLIFERYFGGFVGVGVEPTGFYGRFDSPMGANWLHGFFVLLRRVDASTVGIYFYRGRMLYFQRIGALWQAAPPVSAAFYRGTPYQLVQLGTKLRLMDPETDLILTFETSGAGDGSVRGVESIQDRNGNTHTLSYNPDGTVSRVVDGLGRSLEFAYVVSGGRGRISKVTDQSGRSIQFEHSGVQLTAFADARGKVTTYGSNSDARIESLRLPAGNIPVRNSYAADKVVSQSDGLGNTTRLSYDTGSTTITDPLGNMVRHQFNAELRFIAYTDQAGKSILYGYDSSHRRVSTADRLGDRSGVAYDPASGKVISRTDNEGKTWRYSYTPQAQDGFAFYNLTRIDYPDGASDQFSYDARGNVISRTDRAGKIWRYSYNSRGQVLTATNPAGGITAYTYNADATVASAQDPAGNVTGVGYDQVKRLSRIARPDGSTVQFNYDANDNLLSFTNEKEKTTRYSYDDNNNVKTATDPLGKTWSFDYDANDNLTRVTDPLGNSTTYTYDPLQRVKTVTDRNGNLTTYNYDSRGRLTSLVDPESKTWSLAYDDEGVLTSFTNPLDRTWRFSSDKQGRVKTVTDPLSNRTSFDYDALSRLISVTNPLNEARSYGYDQRGLLSQASLPDNITGAYERNELGLITRMVDPRGKARTRAFDNLGRITSSTDPLGNPTRVSYDQRNRPKQIDLPLSALDVVYDAASLATDLVYSDGTRLRFTYDDANRLTAATGVSLGYDDAGRILSTNGISVTRDNRGRMASMRLAEGKTVTYAYDKRNLLTSVTDWAGGATRFAYDDAGRLTGVTRPNGVVTAYQYDNADRLVGISDSKGQTTLSSIALIKDGAGQTKEAARNVPLEAAPVQGKRDISFNDADQVVGFTYDAMGRLTAGGGRTYKWDLASRLISYTEGQTTVDFTYDAFGNRLTRVVSDAPTRPASAQLGKTRGFVWNYALGLPSISIVRDDGAPVRYYIHTPGGSLLYSIEESDNSRRFYHYDEMGSTLFLTDDRGVITDSYAYNSYGQVVAATGTADNPFTYIGQFGVMREPSTSLYYMRARYYDSATGRFLSRDPVGTNLADPASLNPYQYAAGNPLRYFDPSGT